MTYRGMWERRGARNARASEVVCTLQFICIALAARCDQHGKLHSNADQLQGQPCSSGQCKADATSFHWCHRVCCAGPGGCKMVKEMLTISSL